jgi:hypothetical protein
VAHLIMSGPQRFATDPCSIHGGTNLLRFYRLVFLDETRYKMRVFASRFVVPIVIRQAIDYFPFHYIYAYYT